jgi:phosphatidate cytidylyltransferase|uniref:Phosphatidate cytidylyltransferase n=1 Tax=uncultured bacterium contig00118 TaxID=1181579 RepID=A0A806KFT4_9BACT|nr:phosphatidate cytidylyltransferase [uncultured bacterium contig00118]
MSNLAKRCIFAFTAMPIVAFILWFGDYTRIALILFLCIVATYEWAKMVSNVYADKAKFISIFSPICAAALTMPWFGIEYRIYMFPVLAAVILLYISIAFAFVDVKNLFPWLALHISAPLYLGLWGGMSITLFEPGQGWEQCAKFMVVMTTLWACDSAAYFAGRFLGKHKFSPQISPKKTWEGAIGGTLFSIFWFWIWTRTGFGYTVFDIPFSSTVVLAFIISFAGQLGDLFISALKRWSGIKDSGEIFPGHGGVLDRADSYYLAAPIATILLFYLPT